ncbi:N-acetylglucosamine kinase [Kushneria phosphatilytica]|uniref:N-acetylglucosamine kinase n=1 Tax=Kushneria phosphatilytica TaxID=657387 RepID=A0A1S1NUW1_9GAMM|nr:BadF/BadG/BcrA/BcrD ATPase family protein [Kushneria phosphatilytica]OHV07547.1 N-acetylglucosamine kinase [Kushneria phosphatilytica]QEL10034.1 N-acetylglucosamine kinase [Kushneria phosphatilytica]
MFLGVDGGGTRTSFCLLDDTGRVVATHQTGTCYYLSIGLEEAHRVLQEGVRQVCKEAGIAPDEISHAFFGLPAYGEGSSVLPTLDDMPHDILGHRRYQCGNDMICGWAGSLGGSDGINVIAGTGSMTYGERQGAGTRCGGWGEIFGDEGSAYWIGCRGLNAFTRMSDGRLARGPLYQLFQQHFALSSDLDLIDLVLNEWQADRTRIAELALTVIEAARQQDPQALKILRDAAEELAILVETTCRQLGFKTSEQVPVSYSGGLFREAMFLDTFTHTLSRLGVYHELRNPLHSPAIGAALYAARLAGVSLEVTTTS